MDFDIQTGVVAVLSVLTGVVGVLWKIVNDSRLECLQDRKRCEEETQKLWQQLFTLANAQGGRRMCIQPVSPEFKE